MADPVTATLVQAGLKSAGNFLKDELIKLASETPDEEFDLDLIQTLSRYV